MRFLPGKLVPSLALFAGTFPGTLLAQSGPGFLDQDPNTAGVQRFRASTYFSNVPGGTSGPKTLADITSPYRIWDGTPGTIQQVSTGKTGINGLAAGEYHMCLTVTNLSKNYGGVSNQDVLMGKVSWNTGKPVFTPNTMANALNAAGGVFGMMIDTMDGRFATVDWPTGPRLAYRVNNSLPFQPPVPIGGVTGTYVDPAVAYVNGRLVLFYVSGTRIVYAPLTVGIANGKLSAASAGAGIPVIQGLNQAHSPTPLPGANGDALGLWFANTVGSDSDMYFASQIEQPAILKAWDNTSWLNNGAVAGGRFLCADSGSGYRHLKEGAGHYLLANSGISVQASSRLVLRTGGPSGTPSVHTSVIALGSSIAPPLSIPGFLGHFALNPSPALVLFPGPTSSTRDDVAEISLPATNTSLMGTRLHLQALVNPVDPKLSAGLSSTVSPSFAPRASAAAALAKGAAVSRFMGTTLADKYTTWARARNLGCALSIADLKKKALEAEKKMLAAQAAMAALSKAQRDLLDRADDVIRATNALWDALLIQDRHARKALDDLANNPLDIPLHVRNILIGSKNAENVTKAIRAWKTAIGALGTSYANFKAKLADLETAVDEMKKSMDALRRCLP